MDTKKKIHHPHEIDLAYMAGLFDGEGTVNITWRPNPKGYTAVTKIAVYNSAPTTLELFDIHFSGVWYHLNDTRPRNYPVEMWQVSVGDRKNFITTLLPFMREPKKCWRMHFILEHEELLLSPTRLSSDQLRRLTEIKSVYDLNAEPRASRKRNRGRKPPTS